MSESIDQRGDNIPVRHIVRVLLIDVANRVLLFTSNDNLGQPFWFLPGGGAEPGESAEETARRELWEETGLSDVAFTAELWRRRVTGTLDGGTYSHDERAFLVQVPELHIDTSHWTDEEQRFIAGYRWWTVDELAATTDRLGPPNLAGLVRGLLQDGPPEHPLELNA